MKDIDRFISIAKEQGADIVCPIYAKDIRFDFRTTFKCRTCSKYGQIPTCPPNIPDFDYFKRLFSKYTYGLLVAKKYDYCTVEEYDYKRKESGPRLQEILLFLEKQAFQHNYYWAISFTGGSCRVCKTCSNNGKCQNPEKGRIPLEATGVDVISTCKNSGIEISPFPLPTEDIPLYRVGLLLIE